MMFFLIGGYWITYGLVAAHSLVIVMGSLLVWPLQVSIVLGLQPWRRLRVVLGAVGFLTLFCIVPGVIGGWSASLVGCGLAMALIRFPQIVHLIRSPQVSGVSVSSWLLGASNSILWITYYVVSHRTSALVATALALGGNLAVSGLTLWRQHSEWRPGFALSD